MAGTVLLRGSLLLLAGSILLSCIPAQRIRVRRQNMKVRINATGDTIVMKFVRPNPDVRLEGYILGYGSSMFSKQFIQLPENGEAFETEIDAEPKYLVAVQPIPSNDVKKHCTGKVNLEKPLHLVVGTITPTSVLLSWGTFLKTPYEAGNIMNDCLEDGYYTVRYRERNRKWFYQTCPTSDTVIDNLKPNTPYEFGVRSNKDERSGVWSKPITHNTNMDKSIQKPYKHRISIGKPVKLPITRTLFPPHPAIHNKTQSRPSPVTKKQVFPGAPKTSFALIEPWEGTSLLKPTRVRDTANANNLGQGSQQNVQPHGPAVTVIARTMKSSARNSLFPPTNGLRQDSSSSSSSSFSSSSSLLHRASNSSQTLGTLGVNGEHHKGLALPKPVVWNRLRMGSRPSIPVNKKTNLVGKPGDIDKVNDLKLTDKASILKFTSVTAKPAKQDRRQTTTTAPSVNESRFETWENSSLFSSQPASEVDALGKKRFIAPHVVYKTDKKPHEPCSITTSLNYFPEDEGAETNVTAPPKSPPSNLTVVTVEGCPSFVILDWEKTDNDTTEYEVISTTEGPDGTQVSILTTNQTHTAVENLKPESSYEFKVKPKNELGAGPPSEPVSFNTESADPRVSENVSGKDAIWTQFPFKTDSHSECNGKQYVKRTWYRKFVGIQLCNSLRYKIYLSDSLNGKFYNIGDQTGHGEDHCQFVDSFLDGRTGNQVRADQLPAREGYYRAMRQEPVNFGQIGGNSHVTYVSWYECGTPIPGKW
ncbi:ABI family, member 3 (NESH) binding protein b isoform X4 [Esox lucius]|uniref:ABI family, member 3 (NESH) binding protein b isoform X4 n=1 Tax=Esox lucius TaxID=8010 RepID=UPI0014777EF3|nr:ABI family, member 3 (NESH) binding protein b isoform X4 [Esox lucius]